MPLAEMLSEYWRTLQGDLFPWLEEELGPLGEHHRRFVTVIETVRLEAFVAQWSGLPGRPQKDRAALARAFVAKSVFTLATNAVKFTPSGGTITVFARGTDDGGVVLGVRDSGIGIPPEDLDRITEPYVQARSSQVRAVHEGGSEGTGLGLTLVRAMMELHDGRLELDSTVGVGTTARMIFPPKRIQDRCIVSADASASTPSATSGAYPCSVTPA